MSEILRPIVKSLGTTSSERLLASLGNKSFLSLWSYPNVYRDVGKELCDLLVVCGRHIIVFSDKSIAWPADCDETLAWTRWYRRAVGKSAAQLKRAISWIEQHPDRLFLDAACTIPFPIDLPSEADRSIHGIVVARGASMACRRHFNSGSGSLHLLPLECRTRSPSDVTSRPFCVGNPSPTDNRVFHILDEVNLHIMLTELDTVTDFAGYLEKKEHLILNDHLLAARGEEDLLALYMQGINPEGDHDFLKRGNKPLLGKDRLVVEGGSYASIRRRSEYKRKRAADKISYFWDGLTEEFAKNVMQNTTYLVRGYEATGGATDHEKGLRQLALVSRFDRRVKSLAIQEAFEKIGHHDRFFRAILPGEGEKDRSTGFFLLLLKRRTLPPEYSDDDYRTFRARLAITYGMGLLRRSPFLKRVVGIATEGEIDGGLRSEDLLYAEQPTWTDQEVAQAQDEEKRFEVFKAEIPFDNLRHLTPFEYPPAGHPEERHSPIPYTYQSELPYPLNRAERRKRQAIHRKTGVRIR